MATPSRAYSLHSDWAEAVAFEEEQAAAAAAAVAAAARAIPRRRSGSSAFRGSSGASLSGLGASPEDASNGGGGGVDALSGDPDLDSPLGGIQTLGANDPASAGYDGQMHESTALQMPYATAPGAGTGAGGGGRRNNRRQMSTGSGASGLDERSGSEDDQDDDGEDSAGGLSDSDSEEDEEGDDDEDGSIGGSSTRLSASGGWAGSGAHLHRHNNASGRSLTRSGSGARVGGGTSSSTSASRQMSMDEEISMAEQRGEEARRARKLEAERRRRREQSDKCLPCPALCGVSWGIQGQLVYFSSLPLLTHFLVENARRRAAPSTTTASSSSFSSHTNGNGGAPTDPSGLLSPGAAGGLALAAMDAGAGGFADHEEEESSAWAGASAAHAAQHHQQHATALPLGSPNAASNAHTASFAPSVTVMADLSDVLPRSYHELLQLPAVAAHLGYTVGEDKEQQAAEDAAAAAAAAREQLNLTDPAAAAALGLHARSVSDSSSGSGGDDSARQQRRSRKTASGAMNWKPRGGLAQSGSSGDVFAYVAAEPVPNATTTTAAPTAASSSQAAPTTASPAASPGSVDGDATTASSAAASSSAERTGPPSLAPVAVLDLGSIDLESVVLSAGGQVGATPSGAGGLPASISSASLNRSTLAGAASSKSLDELALGYDLLDELDEAGLGVGGGVANNSSVALSNVGAGGGPGGEDFFAGFYANSSVGLGLASTATAATMLLPAGAGTFYRPQDDRGARRGITVPALPSSSSAAAASSSSSSASATGVTSSSATGATSSNTNAASGAAGSQSEEPQRNSTDEESSAQNGSSSGAAGIALEAGSAGSGGVSRSLFGRSGASGGGAAHTWSSLSQPVVPGALRTLRRRIKINTSVLLMDCESIMPCSARLADLYHLSASEEAAKDTANFSTGCTVEQLCLANQRACMMVGRADLAATWHLVSTLASPSIRQCSSSTFGNVNLAPWRENALGGRLVEQLLRQYLRVGDIQTVAVLTAVLQQAQAEVGQPDADANAGAILPPADPEEVLVHFQETEGSAVLMRGPDGSATSLMSHSESESLLNQRAHDTTAGVGSPTLAQRDTPSPSPATLQLPPPSPHSSSRSDRLGSTASLNALPANHPAHALPASADASSRTWGPGSRPAFRMAGGGGMGGHLGGPVKSSYSSGTASPADTIYNTNANQRLKWRTGPASDSSGPDSAPFAGGRMRAGSMQQQQHDERISRIEESSTNVVDAASVPLPPYSASSHGGGGGGGAGYSGATSTPHSSGTPTASESLSPTASQAQLYSPPGQLLTLHLTRADLYRWLYAEYLFRIGAYGARAQLLKSVSAAQPHAQHALTGFDVHETRCNIASVCSHCGHVQEESLMARRKRNKMTAPVSPANPADGSPYDSHAVVPSLARCPNCLHWPTTCGVCQLSVRGMQLTCLLCGHGGHPEHLASWFGGGNASCPTGCGCRCVEQGGMALGEDGDEAEQARLYEQQQQHLHHARHSRRGGGSKRHSRRSLRSGSNADMTDGTVDGDEESGDENEPKRLAAAARALEQREQVERHEREQQQQLAQQLAMHNAGVADDQAEDSSRHYFYNPSQPAA